MIQPCGSRSSKSLTDPRSLGDPGMIVRETAADALGYIGPRALSAVPALTAALGDPDADVREAAARALRAIDPEAAARAGLR
jgi:HEAT repeat protein